MNKIISADRPPLALFIGHEGEGKVTPFAFDFSEWAELYGGGTLTLKMQRPGTLIPYRIDPEIDGTTAVWKPSKLDTELPGEGAIQLVYTIDEEEVKKSPRITVKIAESLGSVGEKPKEKEALVDKVQKLADETAENTRKAEASERSTAESKEAAEQASRDAAAAKEAAESAQRQTSQDAENTAKDAEFTSKAAKEAADNAAGAQQSAAEAEDSKTAAVAAAVAAGNAAGTAVEAARLASAAMEAAGRSEGNALSSAQAAADSERDATGARDEAEGFKNAAEDAAASAAEDAETAGKLVDGLATEATLDEINNETGEVASMLRQIVEEGGSSKDLNGFSLHIGAGKELLVTYTDPEDKEDAVTVVAPTNTTMTAIAAALTELAEIWKGAVLNG